MREFIVSWEKLSDKGNTKAKGKIKCSIHESSEERFLLGNRSQERFKEEAALERVSPWDIGVGARGKRKEKKQ